MDRRCTPALMPCKGIHLALPYSLRATAQPPTGGRLMIDSTSTTTCYSSPAAAVVDHGVCNAQQDEILIALRKCRTAFMLLAGFAAWAYLSYGNVSGPFASISAAAPHPTMGGEHRLLTGACSFSLAHADASINLSSDTAEHLPAPQGLS